MSVYQQNHKLAKLIMSIIVCALLYLDGSLSIYAWAAVIVWVFGVNPIAYVIEAIRRQDHKHDKL